MMDREGFSGVGGGMAALHEIVGLLDEELKIGEVPDYSGAHNGLQLQNEGEVRKIATAVDASLSVIREAVKREADLLIVHHGLFWQGVQSFTGPYYEKYKLAFDNRLAIYSSHLPLDIHPHYGNNVLLAQALGLEIESSFLEWKGLALGVSGEWEGEFSDLLKRVEQELGPAIVTGGDHEEVGRLGIITGGAGSEVQAVKEAGIDTFITGEGPHWSFPLAEEIGLKVIHAGHYATETYGVKALGGLLEERFEIQNTFIHKPTGL